MTVGYTIYKRKGGETITQLGPDTYNVRSIYDIVWDHEGSDGGTPSREDMYGTEVEELPAYGQEYDRTLPGMEFPPTVKNIEYSSLKEVHTKVVVTYDSGPLRRIPGYYDWRIRAVSDQKEVFTGYKAWRYKIVEAEYEEIDKTDPDFLIADGEPTSIIFPKMVVDLIVWRTGDLNEAGNYYSYVGRINSETFLGLPRSSVLVEGVDPIQINPNLVEERYSMTVDLSFTPFGEREHWEYIGHHKIYRRTVEVEDERVMKDIMTGDYFVYQVYPATDLQKKLIDDRDLRHISEYPTHEGR